MKEVNVLLDEEDLKQLKEWFHVSSEDEAVRSAIQHLLKTKVYSDLLALEGKVKWTGDLEQMREGHV
ncbi:hypothetical protein [Cohnella silvisoli]|uniref:DUF2191 domain-containing protein n=1 Tax=Cohnella silvisoli TaxID=2873699 RepID=A0ABV1KPM5_9BACL|nr:hypothetical protein [Cohnella silvisoli]MCD9025593.1 hypothetical protein [Cohnella silvisoli]